MESVSLIQSKEDARRQRLFNKATRVNKKSSRLQKKIQQEVSKRSPEMSKINKWQKKSAKYVNKGLDYLDQIGALDHQATEISFKIEKVCLCVQLLV
jgi:DNA replication protein DnaD